MIHMLREKVWNGRQITQATRTVTLLGNRIKAEAQHCQSQAVS